AGYQLEESVGQGGMAVVFRAQDERLKRVVALKLLAPGLIKDKTAQERFLNEAYAAAAVDHPHIIPVHDAGNSGGLPPATNFVAMYSRPPEFPASRPTRRPRSITRTSSRSTTPGTPAACCTSRRSSCRAATCGPRSPGSRGSRARPGSRPCSPRW